MKHTREPWRFTQGLTPNCITSGDGYVRIHTPFRQNVWREDSEAHANARRIVACVNACAGVPTGTLEDDMEVKATVDQADEWRRQRDALLAAIDKARELMPLGTKKRADWLREASDLAAKARA